LYTLNGHYLADNAHHGVLQSAAVLEPSISNNFESHEQMTNVSGQTKKEAKHSSRFSTIFGSLICHLTEVSDVPSAVLWRSPVDA
jgi:hypothetical protein